MSRSGWGYGCLPFTLPGLLWVLAEGALIVWLATLIGWGWMLLFLAGSAVAGALIVRWQWAKSWASLMEGTRSGQLQPGTIADSALVLVGGILMIIPGFLSTLGALVFFFPPPTRPLVRRVVDWWFGSRLAGRQTSAGPTTIEGEVVEDDESTADEPTVIEGTIVDEDGRPL